MNSYKVLAAASMAFGASFVANSSQTGFYSSSDTHRNPDSKDSKALKPNILIILTDDFGYADAGFNGCKDIPTPNIDRLAKQGIRCVNAYTAFSLSSPSRASLMTGRYPMRFGHERNPQYNPEDHISGLPLTEIILPQYLLRGGYVTGWVGKWHLGAGSEFHPEKRGFQETFGFLGGGHNFIDPKLDPEKKYGKGLDIEEYNSPIFRNGKPVEVKEHLTGVFGREAAGFIQSHKDKPWFLYLPFNAPHMPNQPTPERLERFKNIKNAIRQRYAAQVSLMDDAVGDVLEALRSTGQTENTLVFFLTDGDGSPSNGSDNTPLRDSTDMIFDGRVKVPFIVSWPKVLHANVDYGKTVSSLDIFATALAVAGVPMPTDRPHDGVNIIPFLTGANTGTPHDLLFWRRVDYGQWGILDSSFKLVYKTKEWFAKGGGRQLAEPKFMLFDLSKDPGEQNDLSLQQPERVKRMKQKLDEWEKQAAPLAFPGYEPKL